MLDFARRLRAGWVDIAATSEDQRVPDHELEPDFPIEFLVVGTPASLQTKRAETRDQWRALVRQACQAVLPSGHFATERRLAATLFYFPAGRMQGDVDNIIKLTLDALKRHVFMDDAQVERVLVQKFEPGVEFQFTAPTPTLARAVDHAKPVLYVRLSADPFEDFR
jgi:crossover junction endodeoxyribonuclease RusA